MLNPSEIDVREYLPHRYPFLFVDRIVSYEVGKSIVGYKNVTQSEPFFQGHFPEVPVFPGVITIEAMAQTSGILIFLTSGQKYETKDDIFFLAGVDNVRYKKIIKPGDQLVMTMEVMRRRKDLWKFKGTATVDGEVACVAEIMTAKG